MKQRKISKTNVVNFSTYAGMVIFYVVMTALSGAGMLNRSMTGLLVRPAGLLGKYVPEKV